MLTPRVLFKVSAAYGVIATVVNNDADDDTLALLII